MTPLTRDFKSNTEAGLSPSISTRVKNGESISVWDRLTWPLSGIAPAILVLGSLTNSVVEPNREVARTVVVSDSRYLRRRKGRRISIEEARQIALRTMEMTDRLLREERRREAEYLLSLSDSEESKSL
jgi:hypothetical protein